MSKTFKVLETFVLPDGSGIGDLADAIQMSADMPFSLIWSGSSENESVSMVKLIRLPMEEEQQTEQSAEMQAEMQADADESQQRSPYISPRAKMGPKPPAGPPPQSSSSSGAPFNVFSSQPRFKRLRTAEPADEAQDNEEEEEAAESQWSSKAWKQSDWKSDRKSDWKSEWKTSEWPSKTPCHVCGKVRSEHPGKKFCDVSSRHKW